MRKIILLSILPVLAFAQSLPVGMVGNDGVVVQAAAAPKTVEAQPVPVVESPTATEPEAAKSAEPEATEFVGTNAIGDVSGFAAKHRCIKGRLYADDCYAALERYQQAGKLWETVEYRRGDYCVLFLPNGGKAKCAL